MLVATLATAALAGVLSINSPAVYRAEMAVVIRPAVELDDPSALVDSVRVLNSRELLGTFSEMARSQRVLSDVDVGTDVSDYAIEAQIVQEASVVDVIVEGPLPAGASELSGAVASATARRFEEFYSIYKVELLGGPEPESVKMAPLPERDAVLAGAVAFVLSYMLALVWARLRFARTGRPPAVVASGTVSGTSERRRTARRR